MNTIARQTLANVLLVLIVASVVVGLVLMGTTPLVAATGGLLTFVGVKVDDARIRRNRRLARV